MGEFNPERRHRWLAKRTIQDRLLRLGWKRFNGGENWDAYCRGQYDPCNTTLHLTWGEYIHQASLTSRNWRRPAVHFQSYDVGFRKMADFESLSASADRLHRLYDLDLDDLGWRVI